MSDLKQSSVALLEKAIDDKIRKSQSKRDTTLATVTRVDNDGTTWVHVYGGADETPVRHMTSSAQVGDIINVTFSGLSCSGIGNVTSPSASQKQVQQVSAENAQAIRGVMEGLFQVKTVVAQKVSTRELDAEMATIISAAIDNATINALNAKYANINQIEAAYAKIDGANINTAAIRDAWVNNLLVQTGLLANDGTVFTLDAVQVDAANITTGTLDVRRLIVTRTIDGVDQKFVVNFDTSGNVTYTKLDGDVLGPQTVAAEKLVAHSITAEQLTIQNIVGTGGWINLANGTFSYGNPLTGQGISWDGEHLDIAGSVTIGSSSRSLQDIAEKASLEVRIESSAGTSFVNGQGSTVLTAKVYQYSDTELDAAGTAFTYRWYLNGTAISGANSKTYTATAPLTTATYTCEVTL